MLLISSGSSACSSALIAPTRTSFARPASIAPLTYNEWANPMTAVAACCGVVGAAPVLTADGADDGGAVDAGGDEARGECEPPAPAAGVSPRVSANAAIATSTTAAATTGQIHRRRGSGVRLTRCGMTFVRSSELTTPGAGGSGADAGLDSNAIRTASADFGRADGSFRIRLATSVDSSGDTPTPSSSNVGATVCTCW